MKLKIVKILEDFKNGKFWISNGVSRGCNSSNLRTNRKYNRDVKSRYSSFRSFSEKPELYGRALVIQAIPGTKQFTGS